jgi:hypothetical protein
LACAGPAKTAADSSAIAAAHKAIFIFPRPLTSPRRRPSLRRVCTINRNTVCVFRQCSRNNEVYHNITSNAQV